jgi:hypothetical protein
MYPLVNTSTVNEVVMIFLLLKVRERPDGHFLPLTAIIAVFLDLIEDHQTLATKVR